METTPLLYHLRRIKWQLQGHPNKLLTNFSAITTLCIFIYLHIQVITQGLELITFTHPVKYRKVA